MSALFQSNITTETALISYLQTIFFRNATTEEVAGLVATYPKNPDTLAGVGASNSTYPEFKRLAAILGNWEFILMSRLLLETFPADVPASSYSAAYGRGTPILGKYHTADVPHLFYKTDDVSVAIQGLYISFVASLDPNKTRGHCARRVLDDALAEVVGEEVVVGAWNAIYAADQGRF